MEETPARRRADTRRRRSDRDPTHDDTPGPGRPARRRTDSETARRPQRARDPEARRAALAAAALEVISESGLARTSHRAVAAKADLPLGATTYYYPTLDDLIAAGLQLAAADLQTDFERWAGRLGDTDDIPAAVAGLIVEYLSDRRRAQIECELYVAAARDAALRPLAMAWLTGMRGILEPHLGPDATRDVMALFDGVTLQALITGNDVDVTALTATIRKLTS
ncbi:TetR family transcriptional regulator [Actinoplanes sp. LDG1-06]|uniref:TetR family transcriptional regulator n=1 Tax=Paractinoplanes ovalisporus TaxID=2810368 RepID=A0ABS2AGB6_9ACTN|nr:TetR family transcriptional regulator [Actinoplanes ovalisporus]